MVIGRTHEAAMLRAALASRNPELVVLLGRRRIGKTFLARNIYKNHIRFEITGMHRATLKEQLRNFHLTLSTHRKNLPEPTDWLEAFQQLGDYISSLRTTRKKVIFIDEFPWLDGRRSRFLPAFSNFWNAYASKRNDLLVVICGSAASYMVRKIIRDKGGLHNRITMQVRLEPFNLAETEQLLRHNGVRLTRYDIIRLYMALGGVPYYLQMVQPGESTAQAIDRLCFRKDGPLRGEFNNVFASLFDQSENHERIVRTLARMRKGMTRDQVARQSGVGTGGTLSKTLEELEASGFIQRYAPWSGTKDPLYRLSDELSLFHLKFIAESRPTKGAYWAKLQHKPSNRAWSGFTFETICLKHVDQIKQELGITGIHSAEGSWFSKGSPGAQVDLLIDRDDNVVNLCEMKFSQGTFTIDAQYARELTNKMRLFRRETRSRKSILLTFITTYGIAGNALATQLVQNDLTMDCLFHEL
ncbi:MAG: ATP-binding protein [Bacteroidetes bacterium]|nr:ATP-binding protein [Bacteroidota bacterium]